MRFVLVIYFYRLIFTLCTTFDKNLNPHVDTKVDKIDSNLNSDLEQSIHDDKLIDIHIDPYTSIDGIQDNVIEKGSQDLESSKPTILDEIIDQMTEKSEDEFLNMNDEDIITRIENKRLRKKQNPNNIISELESFFDSEITSSTVNNKLETEADSDSDSNTVEKNVDNYIGESFTKHKSDKVDIGSIESQRYIKEYDNEISQSLREIVNDYTIKPLNDYVPLSESFNKHTTYNVPDNRTLYNKEINSSSNEIKGIVNEILDIIRETTTISKTQTETIQNFIDNHIATSENTDIVNNLVALINNLEKTKFPFNPDDEFLKHGSDNNPEAIVYSDMHENKWVWRGGDNSLDKFNSITEKRISSDYKKNDTLVRTHKIIRDNKLSETYEEVISKDNLVHDPISSSKKINIHSVSDIIKEEVVSSSNDFNLHDNKVCMFIPLFISILFIL